MVDDTLGTRESKILFQVRDMLSSRVIEDIYALF